MATSLQRQLASLAAPSSTLLTPERRITSILFSTKDAAGYNRETFYSIGREGLNELIGINPRVFEKYETSRLFNGQSLEFERIVEDKEANDTINEEIDEFLISLSPYLMLKSALKCLEWLVNRFHIQKFNIPSILECIMPYYDTKSFSIIVKVIEIDRFKTDETREWHWLIPSVQTALPISKPVLFSNSNPKFIAWMFTTFQKFVKVHGSQLGNLQNFISFMTSTIIGILNSILNEIPKRQDKRQRSLYRSKGVIHCVWSQIDYFITHNVEKDRKILQNEEVQSMIYIICTLLGLIGNQKPEFCEGNERCIGKVVAFILKNHLAATTVQVYLLLNLLVPHAKTVLKLEKSELFPILGEITAIGQSWDVFNISSKILLDNVAYKRNGLNFSKMWSILEYLEFNPTQRGLLMKNIYKKLRKGNYARKKWSKNFLTKFEREYPIEFGIVCDSDPEFAADLIQYKTGENLELMCQHADPTIRLHAVKKILKRFKNKVQRRIDSGKVGKTKKIRLAEAVIPRIKGIKPDINSTAQSILPRFEDDDPNIVIIILKQKDILHQLFTPETLANALIKVISKRLTMKCTKLGLRHICKIALNSVSNKELTSKILAILLPFLFPRKEGIPMKLAFEILQSKFAAQHHLLKQISSVVGKKDVTYSDISALSYDIFKSSKLLILKTGDETLICKIFKLLTFNVPADIDKIIQLADSSKCAITGNYPISPSNFSKCIVAAEKKLILSLDLVFTTIMKLKLRGKPHLLAKIFQFVWKQSEKIENRNLCIQFLTDFVQASFLTPEEQIDFWCWLIRTINQESVSEAEFYLLRTIQFLTSCLEQNSQALKNYLGKAQMSKEKTGMRSRAHPELAIAIVEQPLFEILLAYTLYHDSQRVRLWTLNCLSLIAETVALETTTAGFIKSVLGHREEILTDKEQTVKVISNILQENKFGPIRDRFVNTIVNDATEQRIATGLLKLCSLVNSNIFARFLPTAKDLLACNPDSKILLSVLDCYDPAIDTSLDIIKEGLKHKQTHTKILSKLTREVVDGFDVKWRRTVFGIMVEVVLTCEIPEIKVAVQRCVRKWTLESIIISEELDKAIAMEKFEGSVNSGALQSNTINSRKIGKNFPQRPSNGNIKKLVEASDWGTRTEVVLELIQSKKRLVQKTKLIKPLFKLLKICMALEEQSPVEYLKQLILTSLTLCCYDDFKSQESNDDWIDFNVETVIDCLRCSRNPQTHHHALILLNYAAQLYPEQVLHGVMSLFTFMGNSILRQDDSYSTQLIQQTVTTIIPTFVNTNIVKKYPITRVSAGIYFAFASAVQDIPVHRRLPVFKSLVETLNPLESMWQLCVIIIDKALIRDKKRSHLTADMELAIDVVGKFEPNVAVVTMENIYKYLSEFPIYERITEDEFQIKRLSQCAASKAVVDLTRKDSLRDVEILVYYTLELVMKVCATFAELEDVNLNYETLLEKCFYFSRLVSNIHDDKIFRLITQRNLDIIEKINAALEPEDLIRTVISILGRDDLSVKKKMLDVLNNRIAHKLEWFANLEVLLELIDPLVEFGSSEAESDDIITVIQTAFISMKLISRHLASSYANRFVPVFELTFRHTTHSNCLLRASAFACLGELFCLKALILPRLNSVCSAILKAFKASAKLNSTGMQLLDVYEAEEPTENAVQDQASKHEADLSISVANLLCISTLTCLTKLSDQLGMFLGAKFLQKSLVAVFRIDGIFGHGEKATNRKKTIDQRLKALLKSIGTKIPLRNSLPSIQKIFNEIINLDDFHHINALVSLVDVLKETLTNTNKTDFTTLFQGICDAILTDFLSYRERVVELQKTEGSLVAVTQDELIQVENAILECVTTGIVLKVSEGVFRSFYHRIFDWAGESTERLITFYRFSAITAEKLKSLFVNFAGYVINKAAETLNTDVQLTQAILKYFYHIFSNDREGFITTDRFNALVKPIVDLIESDHTINGEVSIKDINDTLIQLAVATNDLNRWQYLIELISFKSQHANPSVRLFVISTLAAAANELGKDFLPLLPPAVPFLAELLNDSDEQVELETKKMLLKLEEIVGEPLQPYFVA